MSSVLLEARGLSAEYVTESGKLVPACEEADLIVNAKEIVGIAGESASGKSTLLNALTRLQRPPAITTGGEIIYHPRHGEPVDLIKMSDGDLSQLRWTEISMVMQSAMACLNPVTTIAKQFRDVYDRHMPKVSRKEQTERIANLLEMVGIPADRMKSYPHQLSGGMRQRTLIALALACDPQLIVMDEPTTAVDVVMQRQILNQILDLRERLGFAVVFVTHDLSLLIEIADKIAIMYAGRIVETGSAKQIYNDPQHPYTKGLRDAYPPLSKPVEELPGIPGTPPDLLDLPQGCAFAPRCEFAFDRCHTERPLLLPAASGNVACHKVEERS